MPPPFSRGSVTPVHGAAARLLSSWREADRHTPAIGLPRMQRVDPLADSGWDAALSGHADATCSQTISWLRTFRETCGFESCGFEYSGAQGLGGNVTSDRIGLKGVKADSTWSSAISAR